MPGAYPRAVLEKFAAIQMLDAYFPTTDGRWLIFARFTPQPEKIFAAFYSPTSACNCLLNPRHASPRKEISRHNVSAQSPM